MIPGLRFAPLAHPGLNSVAAPRLVVADIRVDAVLSSRYYHRAQPNNSLDASGDSAPRNLLDAAEGALIRAAASTQPFGRKSDYV